VRRKLEAVVGGGGSCGWWSWCEWRYEQRRTKVWPESSGGEQCERSQTEANGVSGEEWRCERRYLIACINLSLALDIRVSFLICFVELDSVKFIPGHYPILEIGDSTWWQCEQEYWIKNWKGWHIKDVNFVGEIFHSWIFTLV